MKKNILYCILCFLVTSCASSQHTTQDKTAGPLPLSHQQEQMRSSTKSLTLGPGDEIEVHVWRHDELQRNTKIDLAGNIYLPLVGEVHAADLNINELREKLSLAYGTFVVNPQVDVSPINITSKKITVLGEIHSPGSYTITNRLGLLEALALAGGKTKDANSSLLLIRQLQGQVKVYIANVDINSLTDDDLSSQELEEGIKLASTEVQPGDIMYVPQSTIADIEDFMQRINNIIAPLLGVQRAIIVWPDMIDSLEGKSANTIIAN